MNETHAALIELAARRMGELGLEVAWTSDTLALRRGELRITGVVLAQRGERVLVLLADLGATHEATPRRVLDAAALLGAGALSVADERYVLRYGVPAAQVATAPLPRIVTYLFEMSAELQRTLRVERQAIAAALFAHYTHEEMR